MDNRKIAVKLSVQYMSFRYGIVFFLFWLSRLYLGCHVKIRIGFGDQMPLLSLDFPIRASNGPCFSPWGTLTRESSHSRSWEP